MKRKWLFTLGAILITLLLTGCFLKRSDYSRDIELRAQRATECFIENNYEDIKKVRIKEVFRDEKGAMSVRGLVNHQHSFHLKMDEFKFIIVKVETDDNFPKLKDDGLEKSCSY